MKTKFKTLIILMTIACFSAVCVSVEAQGPGDIKPGDPVIARADVVYDKGPGIGGNLVHAANGDLIAHWDTRGDGMPGQATQLARSSDFGKTWSKPYATIQSDKPLRGSNTALYNLPDGRMLCCTSEIVWPGNPDGLPAKNMAAYLKLCEGRKFDCYYSFTTDDGRTFSERKRLNDPARRNDFAQGRIIKLPNGDLIWPWGHWDAQPLNGFRRSTDGGLNWKPVVRAWQDPPPGQENPLAFNETAATVCKDGTIVAIARVDALVDKKFWKIQSSDNGHTWTVPRQIEIAGGSPAMYCTPQGQLWLAYRDAGFGVGVGLAVSDDNGDHWRFLYHLKDPTGVLERHYGHIRYTDEDRKQSWRPYEGVAAYPCFAKLSDSRVYVVFHTQAGETPPETGGTTFLIAGNLLRIPTLNQSRK